MSIIILYKILSLQDIPPRDQKRQINSVKIEYNTYNVEIEYNTFQTIKFNETYLNVL